MADKKADAATQTQTAADGMIKITPKRDFIIAQNEIYIELKAGATVEVPARYEQNLKTEKVI